MNSFKDEVACPKCQSLHVLVRDRYKKRWASWLIGAEDHIDCDWCGEAIPLPALVLAEIKALVVASAQKRAKRKKPKPKGS
jgi:hypothetical protein